MRNQKSTTIDWDAVRQRMEAVRVAFEEGSSPSEEEARRILKVRAAALAREHAKSPEEGLSAQVIEFSLAYEKYAIETRFVREVYPLQNLTPLPCTPPFVRGMVNVRGEILSVIDLKSFFNLPNKGLTDLNKIIVLQLEGMVFGVLADAVLDVRRIWMNEVQPSLPTFGGAQEKYLKGITRERTVFLDVEKLLSDPAMIVQEQV